jgi:peptide-methionine (R)-S-oxide reductase
MHMSDRILLADPSCFFAERNEAREELTRRAFVFGGAATLSGLAFWGLRRETVPAARPLAANEGPRVVTVTRFSPDGEESGETTGKRIIKPEAEWRRILPEDVYRIMRQAQTERAGTGYLLHENRRGIFLCAACQLPVFSSRAKFDARTGWPSFWEPIAPENIREAPDGRGMTVRTAVSCKLCDGHLGHVFEDGPRPTGLRYCINSLSLIFQVA